MTHKEFTLTVKKTIYEFSGSVKTLQYQKGDRITIAEDTFELLQKGHNVNHFTRDGVIRYDKNNFENEVKCTTVEVSYSIRKLGQRKAK
jgi:hypothetical protein